MSLYGWDGETVYHLVAPPRSGRYPRAMDLQVLLEPTVNLPRLATVLDELGHSGRLATTRGWDRAHQARLYEAAQGHGALTLAHFVPESVGALTEIIHHGTNTLPVFSHFQKRFTRPEGDASVLWGYNHQANQAFTGPGYFSVHATVEPFMHEGEIAIDYRKLPPGKVASWPPIMPNSARLGRFVYDGMVDVMRGISKHVSIGRAWKNGAWMDAWFVLCREDVS
jgi:hypothetical protein